MPEIVGKAILQRLAFLPLIICYFAHPEPGFCQYIVIVADIHSAVQITTRAFPVAGFCFDDSTFQEFLAIVAEHNLFFLRWTASAVPILFPHNCIRHFCHAGYLFYIVHTDDIRAARDADCHRRSGAFHALVGGQVKCKANERFSGWT